jgi:phosphoglycolate phosphatase
MRFDLLILDLDGTLIDSKLDLALAVNATRTNAGMDPMAHEIIYSYVGNGAPMLIQRSLGPRATEQQAEEGLLFFYQYYRDHMLDNTYLYPGVREGLDRLLEGGSRLAVLTNKPVRFSGEIIDRLDLGTHFERIYGGNSFDTKKPDPYGLNLLVSELDTPKDRALMVGDSWVDTLTARNAGITSCGVTYGLQPETFEEHPPDILVDHFDAVVAAVLEAPTLA